MKTLLPVPKEMVLESMPLINKYVKPAYETGIGETPWSNMVGRALLGDLTMWIAFEDKTPVGAASTEIIDFDGYRCVHIITSATDNHAGFQDFHPFLYQYADSIGAKNLQFWGRKGWSRAADKINGARGEKYKEVYRVFSMEITKNDNDNPPEPSTATP